MLLFDEIKVPLFCVEKTALSGIMEIAKKVAGDVELVSGMRPDIIDNITAKEKDDNNKSVVVFATVGNSELIKEYNIDVSEIEGKREVYGLFEKQNILFVCGSDKRGTIYGMFYLSELLGVSPLVFWGDAKPARLSRFELTESELIISREPSVEYRGFFINDEWPCYGNWTFQHFGGFTAKMYDHVFELLLRLKGNYMWPAMWSSSFALDGPGEENARLADLYGVIIGNSHHEPCLRAGEEWDIYKGEDTIYKTQWNYLVNKDGLLNFWRDGLKRSAKYESIITVGMRGERDSILQGPNSLQENIDVLKDIITEQKKLIDKYGRRDGQLQPCMLAIYKEVEKYYYGDDRTEGLASWDGLKDLILLFCEDNFGHMRFLPENKEHKGGYGMYYHLDYHGDPISYEWINSTPLSAIWEQMTLAYEQDVRKLWIVNVGDLKGNEFPLSYFMDMAYDFDKWGSSNADSPKQYTDKWISMQFGSFIGDKLKEELSDIVTKSILLIGKRRPESLDVDTYSLEGEADDILCKAIALEKRLDRVEEGLCDEAKPGFYSMIGDSLRMGLNQIKLWIYAAYNNHYAKQGKTIANTYAKLLTQCLDKDAEYIEIAGSRENGKWKGMWNTSHIGFRKWNEDGCRNPIIMNILPYKAPRMIISRKGHKRIYQKNYGQPECLHIWDFALGSKNPVCIEVANDGIGRFDFDIEAIGESWIDYKVSQSCVEEQEYIYIEPKEEVADRKEDVCLRVKSGEIMIDVLVHARADEMGNHRVFSVLAKDYKACGKDIVTINDFGRFDSAVKAYPFISDYADGSEKWVTYDIDVPFDGEYELSLFLAPSNKISKVHDSKLYIAVNDGETKTLRALPEDYHAGDAVDRQWAEGVIEQIHVVKDVVKLKAGKSSLKVAFSDGVSVLEKIDACYMF